MYCRTAGSSMWKYCLTNDRTSVRILLLGAFAVASVGSFLIYSYTSTRLHRQKPIRNIVIPEIDKLLEEEQWPFGDKTLSQSDPRLVNLIKENYTMPPPVPEGGKMPEPNHWGDPAKTKYSKFGIVEEKLIPLLFHEENGQPVSSKNGTAGEQQFAVMAGRIRSYQQNIIRGGTFLESGSLGSDLSATLYLERFLGWKGLIAEMVPLHIQNIQKLTRYNSLLVPACVAPVPWPMKTTFTTDHQKEVSNPFATLLAPKFIDDSKTWADTQEKKEKLRIGKADCFPLFSILLAANFTKIDFANVAFGGIEYEVLQTVPFDKVDIKVILFSLNNINRQPPLIHKIMLKHGYMQVPPELFIVRNRDPLYVKRDWAIERKFSFV